MVELIVTSEQAKVLAEAQESVEIVDAKGNRLGFFARRFSDRDIAIARERAASAEPGLPTAAVLDRLGSLPNG